MSSIYSGISSAFIARVDDSHLWNIMKSHGQQRKYFLCDCSTQWMIWRHPLCARNCVEYKGERELGFFWVSNYVIFLLQVIFSKNDCLDGCVCVCVWCCNKGCNKGLTDLWAVCYKDGFEIWFKCLVGFIFTFFS